MKFSGTNQVSYHGDLDYTSENTRWTQNAKLMPACIVKPKSADEVATTLNILVKGGCPFSIKSGGHTPWAGANNIDGGIAIDLSLLNEVTLAKDRSFVRLGSGGTWGHAYNQLNGSGVAFPGGRVKTVGIGGLTLGGGISWFTPRVGWVADNVINYEIVLASGEVKNVNRSSDMDLFMALKGGGNNFGIVTRFDIAAFEHDQRIFGGFVSLSINNTATTLKGFQGFLDRTVSVQGEDDRSLVALEFVLNRNSSNDQILNWITSTGPVISGSELSSYGPMFYKTALANTTRWTTIADFPNAIPPVER